MRAVKEGRRGVRCSFHCFLSTNSETKEYEVNRVDVSIKADKIFQRAKEEGKSTAKISRAQRPA